MIAVALRTSVAALLALLPAVSDAGSQTPELRFERALGGAVATPLAAGTRVYQPAGAVVHVLDYSVPSQPLLTGTTQATPAAGLIVALARHETYLYVAYDTYADDRGGVAVYSLADPDRPVLIADIDDYTNSQFRNVQGLAVAAGHLYLFDSENGLYIAELVDPGQPVFEHEYPAFGAHQHTVVDGNRLYSHGRTWLGQTALTIFDISTASAPVEAGFALLDGYANFSLQLRGPYAYGFGTGLSIHDLSDPANIVETGQASADPVSTGLVLGNHAYALGGDGIGLWSIADPATPQLLGQSPLDSFATDVAMPYAGGGYFATRSDRLVLIDTSAPLLPTVTSERQLPGSADPYDLAVVGDTALILAGAYGLHIADAATLAPLGRFELDLPASVQARAFEQIAVAGDRAYLSSWGYGLFVVDIGNPRAPFEISRLPYEFATAVDAEGDFAYVGRSTSGGEVTIVDVTDPEQPKARGRITTSKAVRLFVHDDHVYLADQTFDGSPSGGLRVIYVGFPDEPMLTGLYNQDCGSANDLALDTARARVYLVCDDGLHIIDVSDPASPLRMGRLITTATSVAFRGDRVYLGQTLTGLAEVDVSNPGQPTFLTVHNEPPVPPSRIRAFDDGRVVALRNSAGLWLFSDQPDALFRNGFEQR